MVRFDGAHCIIDILSFSTLGDVISVVIMRVAPRVGAIIYIPVVILQVEFRPFTKSATNATFLSIVRVVGVAHCHGLSRKCWSRLLGMLGEVIEKELITYNVICYDGFLYRLWF